MNASVVAPTLLGFGFVFRRVEAVEDSPEVERLFGFRYRVGIVDDRDRGVDGVQHGLGVLRAFLELGALSNERASAVEAGLVERAADLFQRQPELAPEQDLLQAQQIVIVI